MSQIILAVHQLSNTGIVRSAKNLRLRGHLMKDPGMGSDIKVYLTRAMMISPLDGV